MKAIDLLKNDPLPENRPNQIYRIYNKKLNKCYIGVSRSLKLRIKHHFSRTLEIRKWDPNDCVIDIIKTFKDNRKRDWYEAEAIIFSKIPTVNRILPIGQHVDDKMKKIIDIKLKELMKSVNGNYWLFHFVDRD